MTTTPGLSNSLDLVEAPSLVSRSRGAPSVYRRRVACFLLEFLCFRHSRELRCVLICGTRRFASFMLQGSWAIGLLDVDCTIILSQTRSPLCSSMLSRKKCFTRRPIAHPTPSTVAGGSAECCLCLPHLLYASNLDPDFVRRISFGGCNQRYLVARH